jgi:hypothetical protein
MAGIVRVVWRERNTQKDQEWPPAGPVRIDGEFTRNLGDGEDVLVQITYSTCTAGDRYGR